jgi:hypothetical protein
MQLMLMQKHFAQLLHLSKLNQITVFTLEGLIGLSQMSPKKLLLLLLLQLHSADRLQQSNKLKAKNETAKKRLYIQIV